MRTEVKIKIQIEMTEKLQEDGGAHNNEKHNLDISWFKYAD